MFSPKKIGVIGAGNMGLQAAMVLADQGFPVYLFDRPGVAQKNLANAVKNKLGTLTGRQRVTALDLIPDNYGRLGECDWILEAVYETRVAKDTVNAIIAEHKKPDAFVTTNTSGISFNDLAQTIGPEFAARYCLTHFFNPIKILPLLEVCGAEGVDPTAYAEFCEFAQSVLGKKVVRVKDTPNFVGNRIGGLALFLPFHLPTDGLKIPDIEAIMQVLFGWCPFKTWDLVGLDLAKPVGGNVFDRAVDDPLRDWWNPAIPQIETLLAKGIIGRKGPSKSGFLARKGRTKLCYDFTTGDYVPAELTGYPTLATAMAAKTQTEKLQIMLTSNSEDPDVRYAKAAFFTMAAYSANMVGKICDEYLDIDDCLQTGFAWPAGIFQLVQMFGLKETVAGIESQNLFHMLPSWFIIMAREGRPLYDQTDESFRSVQHDARQPLPTFVGGIYPDKLAKGDKAIVTNSPDVAVMDISDRNGPVILVVIKTKGNAVGTGVLDGLNYALDVAGEMKGGLVIAGQGRMFGAGANLANMLSWIEAHDTDSIRHLIKYGQDTMDRLCFSDVPTVAAPHGVTFGGSCEICLACDRRVVNANVAMGQTELQVGVTPGWGGLMRPLKRVMQGLPTAFLWGKTYRVAEAIEHIDPVYTNYSWIKTSRDGYHAREMGFLGSEDVIVPAQGWGQPSVLKRAKEVVQSMLLAGYQPPSPFIFNLPGKVGYAKLALAAEQGFLTDSYPVMDPAHNTICAKGAGWVLCGGDVSLGDEVPESRLLELEAEVFMDVVMRPGAAAYIRKLLKK